MEHIHPNFNIVTPIGIKELFKQDAKKLSQRFVQLMQTKEVTSIRIKTARLNISELIELTDYLKRINTRKIPILLEDNIELAAKLKVEGVHLTNGSKFVKKAKAILSKDQVIGAFCGTSKHSGLVAAEQGANYVSFNADSNFVKKNSEVKELFEWWSCFIEIPIMGECSENSIISKTIWNYCDFFSLYNKIWEYKNTVKSFLQPT